MIDDEKYTLKKSSSGMSMYSDLVEEILCEQKVSASDFDLNKKQHKIVDVIENSENSEKTGYLKEIKKLESDNKKLGHLASTKNKKISLEEKKRKQSINNQKKTELLNKISRLENKEINYLQKDLEEKRIHLFRGKNLNSTLIDPQTKKQRYRTQEEKKDFITKKYVGKTLYSDGTELIKNISEKLKEAVSKIAAYFKSIKRDKNAKGATALFNQGKAYDKTIETLMKKTELTGSPVIATSKLPWIAPEYMVGQMGGNAGNGRSAEFGYQKDGIPINRVMGNGFIISIPVKDYNSLRGNNYLIDVNIDMGRGVEPNRIIEEVTFASKIEAQYMQGSLPMVLPRLDRDWGGMSRKKHAQYKKIFGLDKNKYNKFKNLLNQREYPLGELTEHLIKHHGNLMRKIAIKSDRRNNYQGEFVVTRNSLYHGMVEDINKNGNSLASRGARAESAKKKSPYLEKYAIFTKINTEEHKARMDIDTEINRTILTAFRCLNNKVTEINKQEILDSNSISALFNSKLQIS